jgi:hypothetical protein
MHPPGGRDTEGFMLRCEQDGRPECRARPRVIRDERLIVRSPGEAPWAVGADGDGELAWLEALVACARPALVVSGQADVGDSAVEINHVINHVAAVPAPKVSVERGCAESEMESTSGPHSTRGRNRRLGLCDAVRRAGPHLAPRRVVVVLSLVGVSPIPERHFCHTPVTDMRGAEVLNPDWVTSLSRTPS